MSRKKQPAPFTQKCSVTYYTSTTLLQKTRFYKSTFILIIMSANRTCGVFFPVIPSVPYALMWQGGLHVPMTTRAIPAVAQLLSGSPLPGRSKGEGTRIN